MKNKKFLSLQYLRAVSILGVVYAHISYSVIGILSVDILFVLSGFIILFIIDKKKYTFKKFLFSRIFRILPFYYIVMSLVLILGYAHEPNSKNIILSFLFINPEIPILEPGWTLQYEMFFYIVCAVSLIFIKEIKSIYFILSLILLGFGIFFNYFWYLEKAYNHLLEFWMGMSIFFIIRKDLFKKINKIYIISILLLAFLFSIYYSYVLLSLEDGRIPYRFIVYGIPAFLIVLCSLLYEKYNELKEYKILLLVGNASFSIYMSHMIIIYLYSAYIDSGSSDFKNMVIILLSVLVGFFIYLYIEKPYINFYKVRWVK